MKPLIAMIGMGRFGRCFANILEQSFNIVYYDPKVNNAPYKRIELKDLHEIDKIVLCPPISSLMDTLIKIAPLIKPGTMVMDTASVKTRPAEWMQQCLGSNINCIATHPLFGPDSYPNHNTIVMHPVRCPEDLFHQWQSTFESIGLKPLLMDPTQHDKGVSLTQVMTHYIGRQLECLNLTESPLATQGYERLRQLQRQTCNDSEQLFLDLIHYNPFSEEVLNQLTQHQNRLNEMTCKRETINGQQ